MPIETLPDRLLRIVETPVYLRGEELDLINLVSGTEFLRECIQTEPLIGRAFESAVIEIEAIYVSGDVHKFCPGKSKDRPEAVFAAYVKT